MLAQGQSSSPNKTTQHNTKQNKTLSQKSRSCFLRVNKNWKKKKSPSVFCCLQAIYQGGLGDVCMCVYFCVCIFYMCLYEGSAGLYGLDEGSSSPPSLPPSSYWLIFHSQPVWPHSTTRASWYYWNISCMFPLRNLFMWYSLCNISPTDICMT